MLTFKRTKIVKNNKLFNLFNIIVIYLTLFSGLTGQKLDWYIQPVLTGIEDFEIEEYTKNIIAVRNDGKWGAKTTSNELIVPITYQTVNIYNVGNIISTFDGEKMAYFDSEGYSVTKEIAEKSNAESVKIREELNRQSLLNRGGLFRIYHNKVQNYINKSLDTILRLTDTSEPRLYGDKFYVTVGSNISRIYDKKGNLVKSYDFRINNLTENRQGYYTSWYAQRARLFDKDLNLIDVPVCNNITLHDSLNVMIIEKNNKFVITDFNLNLLLKDSFSILPFAIKKSDFIIIPLSDHTLQYSISNKKIEKLPFTVKNTDKNGRYLIVKELEKYGVYDFVNSSYFLPAKYDFLSFKNNMYIARHGDKKSKHYELISGKGESIFLGHYNNMNFTRDGFIIVDTTKNCLWYDKSGKLLKKFAPDEYVEYNKELNAFRLTKKGSGSKSYMVFEYFSKEKPRSFESLGERLNPYSKDQTPIYIMQDKGKYGIIDIHGKIILEPTFTKFIRTINDKWIVEYNGKIGALNLPKIPL